MSSSDPNSKVDLLDPPEVLKRKIFSAHCEPGDKENNGVLALVKFVLFARKPRMVFGGITYHSYAEVEDSFSTGTLSPEDLKSGVFEGLDELLKPIREKFANDHELILLAAKAYPENNK